MNAQFFVLALAGITTHVHAEIYDDFSNPKWVSFSNGSTQTSIQNEKVFVNFTKKSGSAAYINGGMSSKCQLSGDFDISTDFGASTFPSSNGVRIGLMIDTNQQKGNWTNYSWATIELESHSDNKLTYVSNFDSYSPGGYASTPTTDLKGKLRLVRIGTQLTGYYWDVPSSVWVKSQQIQTFTTAPVYFSITSWTHDSIFSKTTVKTWFDNIRINTGTCN